MAASFSQSLATFVIPTAERTDPEPVRSSLAQALAEFERGAVREALRHLRRAAESADEAGNELRSVALARAAADLATEVGTIATPPPPPPPALAPPAMARPAIGPSVAFTAPAVAAPAVAPPLVAPPPVAPPPVAPAVVAVASSAVAVAPPAVAAPAVAAPAVARVSPDTDGALKQLLESGRAVKVVVKRSTRDEGLYVVRRADEGAPTLGAREAVMVLLQADDGFFQPPKA